MNIRGKFMVIRAKKNISLNFPFYVPQNISTCTVVVLHKGAY